MKTMKVIILIKSILVSKLLIYIVEFLVILKKLSLNFKVKDYNKERR